MPSTKKITLLFFTIILVVFFLKVNNVSASVLTLVDTSIGEQSVFLNENQASIFFSAKSLSKQSRVSFWLDETTLPQVENMLSPLYAWQILDAQIVGNSWLEIPQVDASTNWQVYFSTNGQDFFPIDYELKENKIKIPITTTTGKLYVSPINLADFKINLDASTVQKGYPVKTPDGYFNFYILPDALQQQSDIYIKPLPINNFTKPAGLELVSPIFYFYIDAANGEFPQKDLPIDIKYFGNNIEAKDIYYWDNVNLTWLPSPSITRYQEGVVRTHTHQREMILAVFANGIMEKGVASWYRYKGGDFAASPDYPKGTKLKVTNLTNFKSVIVTVNDYGPDRSIHPERVIDLDRVAFIKIADPSSGVVVVSVEENYY